jgi:hypothetical protein
MASASDQSILKGVDLSDTKQIRKIMRGLQYHLTHSILSPSSEHLRDLSQDEASLLCTIMAAIRLHAPKYPLLLEASLRFVSEQYRDDKGVQSAAIQFTTLADGPVYTAPNLHLEAYEEAEASIEHIRGRYDVLRIRQRATELVCISLYGTIVNISNTSQAPGAFGRQIYSTSRAAQVEAIASKGSGDVRDIPEGVQFRPRPAQDGPNTLNSGRCEQCICSNSTCDLKEPQCTECRFTWRECFYKTPSSGIVEEPAATATPEPASPVATVPAAPKPAPAKATAEKPTATKPAASKAIVPKPAATKATATKLTAPKPAASKGGPATRATASKVTAEKATEEKPAATKPVETKPAAKATAPKPAAKAAAPKPATKATAPKVAAPKVTAPKTSAAKPASAKNASLPISHFSKFCVHSS